MQTANVQLDKPTIERLKRDVSVLEVMERYGIHAERRGKNFMALCPFHEDAKPSLSIDPVKNSWKCFGCQRGTSVIDFVMEKEGIDFKAASIQLLTNNPWIMTGTELLERQQQSKPTEKPPEIDRADLCREHAAIINDVIDYYHRTLSGEDSRGLDYLKRRGLADPETLKTFKVGYCNGTLNKVLPADAVEPLKKIGLLRKDSSETFNGCIVIPVFTETGELGECFARFIVDRETTNHLYLPGPHRGVLNARAAEVYPDGIILAEAAFDALAVYAIGHRNVIPCYGTGGYTADHADLLNRHQVKRVYLAFDADQAGDTAAKKLADRLTADGIECHRVHLPKEIGTDLNDYVQALRREGMKPDEIKEAFAELLRKAPQIGFKREKKAGNLTLAEHTTDSLIFTNCDLSYRLRGLFDNGTTSLRLVVAAMREDPSAAGHLKTHIDRFDLYTARSRKSFAYRAAEQLGLPSVRIEQDLDKLIPVLETILAENKSQREDDATPRVPPMSEADKKDALALLRSPRLLETIVTDIEIVGFVGEEDPKLLTYLIATSRKLAKPLSAIIRSESGAGKSFLMECVADMMPPEDVKYFSRLTPQSLYYMGRDELVHKLLIVDERDGSEEAEYPIRTLQTRRVLTLAVPVKDPAKGTTKTKCIEILGPLSFMESTTSTVINPENANRNFEIYLDESEDQTRRIYEAQRKAHTLEGWKNEEKRQRTIQRHHNAQRLLEPVRVLIPYTHLIKFPESWTRGRRDHERMLYLVEAIAFLHQHQRERRNDPKKGEYIEATVDDYAQAYSLARTALGQALCDIPRVARQMLSQIKVMVKEWSERLGVAEKDYGFRQRDVREYTKLPHYVVKRAIRSLEELEYIRVRSGGRGRAKVYSLTKCHEDDDPLKGLTTPEELRKRLENAPSTGSGSVGTDKPGQNRDK